MRGCTLIDDSISFEAFVDLLHGKKFKYVRPGNGASGIGSNQISIAVTPEVFILQVDLLTSCTSDPKSDHNYPVRETTIGVEE